MKLIADSGSTKTDWIIQLSDNETSENCGLPMQPNQDYDSSSSDETLIAVKKQLFTNEKLEFRTAGLNPYFLSEKEIVKIISNAKTIQPFFQEIDEIYFFGAGCSSPDKREIVSNALSTIFKNAFVSVDNDIIGSAYACCGNKPGISCILGTGSNISYSDGNEIIPGNHGLGYILGDEASGSYFGKLLLTHFLYGKMPKMLAKDFKKTYQVKKESIITRIYQKPFPNTYLASFAPFLSKFCNHPYIISLLRGGFNDFIQTNIKPYSDYTNLPCHFVGSIAFHFKDILIDCCNKENVKVGKILKHPIEELYEFICSNETSKV